MELMDITIWLTTACNLNCHYCYENEKQKIFLTTNTAIQMVNFIIDYLGKNNIKHCNIHFHGGEPLLNEEVLWLIIHELQKNSTISYKYSITTNGTIMSDSIKESIIKYIDNISISIDGLQFIHDKNRQTKDGKSCYPLVLSNAEQLLKAKPDVIMRMTITPETVSFLYDNIIYLLSLGFSNINHAIDYWDNNWTQDNFEEYIKQIKMVRNYVQINSLNVKVDGINKIKIVKKSKCAGGIYSLNIYPNGYIYPCICVVGDKKFCIGNINNGIKKTWMTKLIEINSKEIEICADCLLREGCISNRCRFFNKTLTGSYYIPSTNICSMQNAKYQLSKD